MTTSSNSSPLNDPWQQLRSCCASEMFCVPKTWSDPFREDNAEFPRSLQVAMAYIQNRVVRKPWCDTLALLSLLMTAQNLGAKTMIVRLGNLHIGFEKIFAALDLHSLTDWKVDTHITQYLTGQIVVTDTKARRAEFWTHYQAGSRLMKRWLVGLPVEQQTRYMPFILPYPADSHELTVLSKKREVAFEQQEKRKEDTDAIMPFYADLRTHGHLRYNLLLRIWKAYHQAIERVEKGQAELPLVFTLTETSSEHIGQGPPSRLVFKLWDRQTLGLRHLETFSPQAQANIKGKRQSYSNEKNVYLLEFLKAESLDENSPSSKPWFIELIEQDVLGSQRCAKDFEKKKKWLQSQGYDVSKSKGHSPFCARTPGVLHPPISYCQLLNSLREKVEITLLPIESLYVAALFGMVALCILTANGMRVGELIQIRVSADGIVPITLPLPPDAENQTPTIHWAVRAVPKGHHASKTYYLDDEHLRLLSLVKLMLCHHYHIDLQAGGELPKVVLRGDTGLRVAPAPDQYLFQYGGKSLIGDDIRVCLRFLLHGLVFRTLEGRQVIVYPHLLRHGFTTWALNVAKEPIDIVAAILNQKNIRVTGYYGRPNPRLVAERSHGLMRQISSYIDVTEVALRGPEELRTLLQKAKHTHGTLNRTRGGRCLLCGECPIFFACIGCSAKVPDPAQRNEVEETKQVVLIEIEQARKKGLTLEVAQYQKKLKQCEAELREMDMIEACRADELREPEVNFDVEA